MTAAVSTMDVQQCMQHIVQVEHQLRTAKGLRSEPLRTIDWKLEDDRRLLAAYWRKQVSVSNLPGRKGDGPSAGRKRLERLRSAIADKNLTDFPRTLVDCNKSVHALMCEMMEALNDPTVAATLSAKLA